MQNELNKFIETDQNKLNLITNICGEAVLAISLDARNLQVEDSFGERSWIVVTGEETPDFNMAMVGNTPHTTEDITGLVSILKDYKLPAIIFTPLDNNSIKEVAEKENLVNAGTAPLMELDINNFVLIDTKVPKKLKIEPVINTDQLKVATKIQAESLEFDNGVINRTLGEKVLNNPNVKTFIGYENGYDPVATMMVVEHGNIATIWNVGTLPEKQEQGFGTEMMREVLRWYINKDIKKFYLISSEVGKKLYDKLGFQTIQELDTWLINDME